MSYCREEGKDKLIFVTEEDHSSPSNVVLPEDDEDEMEGLIKPSGEINWDCPCLQGMADGPCGEQFKDAFSCFHYSEEDPKGSDCIPQFRDMQICFSKYPEIYGKDDDESKDADTGKPSEQIEGDDAVVLSSDDELESNIEAERSVAKASASVVPDPEPESEVVTSDNGSSSYVEVDMS